METVKDEETIPLEVQGSNNGKRRKGRVRMKSLWQIVMFGQQSVVLANQT
jgi:hypothetical protein